MDYRHPDLTVYDPAGGVYYEPFVSPDGRVGYRVGTTDGSGRETFIYLNPSDSSEGDTPNVFLYEGVENDPALDYAVCWVTPEAVTCITHHEEA